MHVNRASSVRSGGDRTTLGHLRYVLAPAWPYRTTENRLGQRGDDGLVEFPLTVIPIVRLPFFATFLLATGLELFKVCYRTLKALGWPIQYQFHLSDFVDYSHPELADQVPDSNGGYVPQALRTRSNRKWDLFKKALSLIAEDYTFSTLAGCAKEFS